MAQDDARVYSTDKLHLFGEFLKRSEDELSSLAIGILTEVYRVSDEWQDKENQVFAESIEPYIDQMKRLIQKLDEYSRFVHHQASILDDYKSGRLMV